MDGKVALGKLKLRIPNLVIHSLYVEKLRQLLLPKVHDEDYQEAVEIFFLKGDLQPLCDFIEPRFDVFSNRDYRWQAEIAVKTAFMMLLFDDRLYVVDSEPELKRCYADLTLIARPDARQYEILDHLLEFKFIKLTDLALSNEQVRELTTEQLKALPLVKTAFEQAEKQLKKYRLVIEKRHGTVLKLQTTAVVALGFERLLWL